MIKNSFRVRALIGFSQGKGRLSSMLCTLRTKEDHRKMILKEESFGSFPVGREVQRKRKRKNICSTIRILQIFILQVFLSILTGLSFRDCCLFFWILARLNKNRLSEAASCCLPSPPHLYKSHTESGLLYLLCYFSFIFSSMSSSSSQNNSCTSLSCQTHFTQWISDSCDVKYP